MLQGNFFLNLLLLYLTNLNLIICRCEYLWFKNTDLYGVDSNEAKYYANLHDKLLESRKNGYYLSSTVHSSSLLESSQSQLQLQSQSISTNINTNIYFKGFTKQDFTKLNESTLFPHYLSKPFHQTYHSTSILGKLYDYICESINEVNLNSTKNYDDDYNFIDPSFQLDYKLCCYCMNNLIDENLITKNNYEKIDYQIQNCLSSNFTHSLQLSQSSLQSSQLTQTSQIDDIKSSYLQKAKEFFQRYIFIFIYFFHLLFLIPK